MGSVETLVDIAKSEENKKEVFYNVPIDIIKAACEALQRERKAEVLRCMEKNRCFIRRLQMSMV